MRESPAKVFARLGTRERPDVASAGLGRAVVLGGSVKGLLAARVLADHADEVVLLERDEDVGTGDGERHGVPQWLQVHALLPGGRAQIERWFPGFGCEAASANDDVSAALHRSQLIDLTTTGRRSGLPRRIEIFLHDEDGVLFITGMPRRDRTRDWIHNITADPQVIVHLKKGIEADVPATARVITDPQEARPLIEAAARRWRRDDVDEMIAHSPLIVLTPATASAA